MTGIYDGDLWSGSMFGIYDRDLDSVESFQYNDDTSSRSTSTSPTSMALDSALIDLGSLFTQIAPKGVPPHWFLDSPP